MDLKYLYTELYLWIIYEWDEPQDSKSRKDAKSLLLDLGIVGRGMSIKPAPYVGGEKVTVASILKKICEIVRSTNQEFPEEIRNLILMYSL